VVLLIALQLTAAGVITTLLDEMLAAGHGFCGGAKLFIATSACTAVFAGLFSPVAAGSVAAGESGAAEVQGALWAVFSLLGSRSNKLKALQEAIFYRGRGLPSIANVAVTVALAAGVAYLQVGGAWPTGEGAEASRYLPPGRRHLPPGRPPPQGCRLEIPVRGGVRGQKVRCGEA